MRNIDNRRGFCNITLLKITLFIVYCLYNNIVLSMLYAEICPKVRGHNARPEDAEICPKVRRHNAQPEGECIMPSNLRTYFGI